MSATRTRSPALGCRLSVDSQDKVKTMQVAPEIAFHNIDSSDSTEATIRDHIARLEQIYGRMTTCRVRVDQRNQNANGTIPPVVRIEIGVPGYEDIVVAHEPAHLQRKFQTPDLRNAINDAFRIAEQRLAKFKDKRSDHGAAPLRHEAALEFVGQVAELTPEKDFGFLMSKDGAMLYFHRNSVLTGDFDRLRRGDDVSYVEKTGDTGPMASKVRAIRG